MRLMSVGRASAWILSSHSFKTSCRNCLRTIGTFVSLPQAVPNLILRDQPEHRATVSALIDAELNSPRFRGLGWSNDDFYLVKEELLCKSESMILWVHLQLQELDQCTGHEAREMLLTLPNSLDQTYARILSKISPRRRRAVRAVLECIIVAPGLLTPTEIGEILLFQFNHINDYPQLLPLAHTVHSGNMGDLDIFKLLPGLLKTNKVLDRAGMISPGLSVEFIHFTVKEYLLSSQTDLFLPQMHDAIGVRSMLAAFGTSLAKASVTFALVLLSALDEQNSSALPSLSEFASGGWLTYTKAALPQYSYIAPALGHFLHPDSRSFRSWAAGYFLGQYDSSNTNEDHPLHWAVRLGSRDEVKRILAAHPVHKGLDIRNAYDRRMWTPICYAACMGNLDILSDLLKANPLWAAQRVGQNYQSTVHLVISQSLITSRQRVGVVHIDRTHWKLPNLQIFQRLCDSAGPTDRFAPDMSGNSAITDAIRLKSSNKFGIIKLFLEKGADSNTKNGEGLSLAHLAARDDECTSIIHALVQEHGVDVETLDNWGRTPLLYAFPDDDDFNHPQMLKCVRSLLNEGADPNAHDYHGLSVLDYALKSVFHGLDKYIRSSLYYDNEPGHRLTFYMPYTEELDILKRIYDLIEGRGGCHATLETPHTPEGRWSWLKLWQGGRYQNSGYKDRLTSEKFKQYLERIDWR
ncbi:ankyrin [Clavulina sp. PMI_390]|nr:ankyrin [Clavulina sp. PMI_390]